jgi:type IV pilus assembly protein PilW
MSGCKGSSGFTLIEVLIATTIACTIFAGVLAMYAQVSGTYRVNERIARLQEQGRFALAMMEPDIELAGYYGFTNTSESIRFVYGANPAATLATAAQLRQFPARVGDPLPAALAVLPSSAQTCGINYAVDVALPVQGSNNAFALGRGATCAPYQSHPQVGADTLTLRRVETEASAPEAGRIQVYASRLAAGANQLMFADGQVPGAVDDDHRVHNFLVRAYYVARDSVGQNGFPALRVKTLTRSGGSASFVDDEVIAGVEDMQVQLGIDADGVGRATRYVNPDFAGAQRLQIFAVRVWLRIRADTPEAGFDDGATYRYADVAYTPIGAERTFRRVLMSRTITLRNARVR